MLIWGWGKKLINLGFASQGYCPTCEKERNFHYTVLYSYLSIFWITMLSWGAKYYHLCEICERGIELDKSTVSTQMGKNPIPWRHRFGWLIPVSIIAVIVIVASISSGSDAVSLEGNVSVTNGDSPSEYVVYIFKDDDERSYDQRSISSDGHYRFTDLPAGRYEIYIYTEDEAANLDYVYGQPDKTVYVRDGESSQVSTIYIR